MLRLVLCADLHCKGETVTDVEESRLLLRLISDFAISQRCNVICCGDFFHQKNVIDPPAPIVLAAHDELSRSWDLGSQWHILMGNHDTDEPDRIGHSVLSLYKKIAFPILIPTGMPIETHFIGLVPWAPADQFRVGINHITKQAMGHTGGGAKILFSHISLQEGHVSPSNRQIHSPIRASDLHPLEWDVVFLGDYHAAQQVVGTNIYYLGAPRPQAFNDYDNIGIWLLEVNDDGTWQITPNNISHHFPGFRQYQVRSESDLPLPGYNSWNKNRIFVNLELKNRVRTLYPDAQCRPLPDEGFRMQDSRIGNIETEQLSPLQIVDRWRQIKGLPEQPYMSEAKHFIEGGTHAIS